jgi:hypothetical protein
LPMWVFDGNGFTMAGLTVWIRKRRAASVFRSGGAVSGSGCDDIRLSQLRQESPRSA